MQLTRPDTENGIQHRYRCPACDQNMLVASGSAAVNPGEAPPASGKEPSANNKKPSAQNKNPSACNKKPPALSKQPAARKSSAHERKIAALESQLALVDQEIAKSQLNADQQEAELMRAKLGVADLRNLEAATVKHSRLITMLNELHRTHYSKELVLAETEHEKDQLKSHLESLQASAAEMKSFFQAEIQSVKKARETALQENHRLKQRTLALENKLRDATDAQADALKEKEAASRELKALSAEAALDVSKLHSQLNVMRNTLDQTTISAEQEHARLMEKIRQLQAQKQTKEKPTSAVRIDVQSANSELEEHATDLNTGDEPAHTSTNAQHATDAHLLATKEYTQGVRHITGNGAEKSELIAISYFEKAARLGHAPAQHNLGVIRYKGSLDARDLRESVYWLSQAASQGQEKAALLLPEVEAAYKMYEQQNIAV